MNLQELVAVGDAPFGIDSGLLNNCGDTLIDLVCVNSLSNSISVLVNDGVPNLFTPYDLSIGEDERNPRQVLVGDVNNDGLPDIIVTTQGETIGDSDGREGVSVFLMNPCPNSP